MDVQFLIKMLIAMLGEYLVVPAKAAKYAKWFLRGRDYLNLLFPIEKYPADWSGTSINPAKAEKYVVPESAIVAAGKERGFNIPFIKGM